MRLLVIGNAAVDRCYRVDRLPREGESLLAAVASVEPGLPEVSSAVGRVDGTDGATDSGTGPPSGSVVITGSVVEDVAATASDVVAGPATPAESQAVMASAVARARTSLVEMITERS